MQLWLRLLLIFLLVTPIVACSRRAPSMNYRLSDHLGEMHNIEAPKPGQLLLLSWSGNGCPIVQQSIPELERIAEEYEGKGVIFFWVNGNPGDLPDEINEEAREFEIKQRILLDREQKLTTFFSVERTGEVVLLNDQSMVLYRGALDDRFDYGAQRPARHRYLREAIERALESGTPTPYTTAKGCLIEPLDEGRDRLE